MKRLNQTLILLMVLPFLWVETLPAQIVVDLPAIQDNTLYIDAGGGLSNGAGNHFFTGLNSGGQIRRGLLRFEVVEFIPPGSQILSADVILHMSRTSSPAKPVELHRVLANWGEGASIAPGEEGQGVPATPGDATWIHTFFDTSFWAGPGGDFSPVVSAVEMVADTGFYTWNSTSELVADVQGWLDNSFSNFGWLVLGDESSPQTSKRFDSHENPTPGFRPVLRVSFSPPTGIAGEDRGAFSGYRLEQNFPNPFNPSTTVRYRLSRADRVTLAIYNIAGQQLRLLVKGRASAGEHEAFWDGRDDHGRLLPAGIYFLRMTAGQFHQTRKLVLLP